VRACTAGHICVTHSYILLRVPQTYGRQYHGRILNIMAAMKRNIDIIINW
jgi:hypothetical protein